MLDVCNEFGQEYGILFNSKKTVCISFGKWSGTRKVYLRGKELKWEICVKYLQNYVHEMLDDEPDVMYKRGLFIQSVNKLMCNFGSLQVSIICKLFQSVVLHIMDVTCGS